MTTRFNRIVTSVAAAAILVATIFAGLTGTASAMPAQQGGMAANVVLTIPAAANVGGNYDETVGQSWVWMYRVADHGMFTDTVDNAVKANNIGTPGSHELKPNGNRQFRGSADPGDYLAVAHLGPNTYVMNKIVSIADGNQYPGQTHVMSWTGSGTTANTGAAKPAAKTGTTAKSAAPLGTAMCLFVTTAPITTTKTATIVVGTTGNTFTGRLLFIQATDKMLTAESALAAYDKDNTIGFERNLDGMPATTKVSVKSGNLRVFRLQLTGNGKRDYLGDVDAAPNSSHTGLMRVTGVCEPFDLRLAGSKAATTGFGLDLVGWALALTSVLGLAFVNRRRFPALSLNR